MTEAVPSIASPQTLLSVVGGTQGADGDVYQLLAHPSLKKTTFEVRGIEEIYRGMVEAIHGDDQAYLSATSRDGTEFTIRCAPSLLAEHGIGAEDSFVLIQWRTPTGTEQTFHRVEREIVDPVRHRQIIANRLDHYRRMLGAAEEEVTAEKA